LSKGKGPLSPFSLQFTVLGLQLKILNSCFTVHVSLFTFFLWNLEFTRKMEAIRPPHDYRFFSPSPTLRFAPSRVISTVKPS
jgi:hypothetical protein